MSGNYSNDAIVYSYGYNDATGTLSSMMMSSAGVVGTVTPRYDSLGRMTRKTVVYNGNPSTELELFRNELSFNYRENNGYQSSLISQYVSTVHLANNQAQTTTYKYTYNGRDSITEIRDGNNAIQYKYYYDELGQLTREDNIAKNKTYTYAYDDAGNITSKKTYAFTTGDLGTASSTVNYTYGDATWGDLLTKYGTTNITYDEIGNPTKIGYYDLTWQGRELQSWSDDESTTVYYGYNADGIRTYKEILDDDTGCGTRHEYILDGGTILYEMVYSITPTSKTESYIIVYLYDENGSPVGMKYRTPSYGESTFDYYFFEKNLQGDIIAIHESNLNQKSLSLIRGGMDEKIV